MSIQLRLPIIWVPENGTTSPVRSLLLHGGHMADTRYVYDFSEGSREQKDLRGGMGANLA
jgi:hypothetical protein